VRLRCLARVVIRIAKLVLANAGVALMLLCLIEGVSSFLLTGRLVFADRSSLRRTEYDQELGWVNRSDVFIENAYGPGGHFTTNSQRWRGRRNFSRAVPDGKIRIVCSGDSFTVGYGVDDDHTWCELLSRMDQRLETVNLGVEGYGVDQAYLWYKRNEQRLDHDIHIFAFITDDFRRMQRDTFEGYSKPVLRMRDNALVRENRPYSVAWRTVSSRLGELRTFQLLQAVARKFAANGEPTRIRTDAAPTEEVVARIFAELRRANQAKRSVLVLVYLPVLGDYVEKHPDTSQWQAYVTAEASRNGHLLLDLTEALHSLSPGRARDLFTRGHYTLEGNKYFAEILYQRLRALPDVLGKARGNKTPLR
jgi:hypothetical protein